MMLPAATAPLTPGLAVRSVVDVCAFVDELPTEAAGELVFVGREATPDGSVFVENGRICWAAARGLARRLSDLLAKATNLDPPAMEALYSACRREKAPLGEYLVDAGILTAEGLRSALLEHTGESLRALCADDARAEWAPRGTWGYDSRFTFKTTELLSRACPERFRSLAESAAAELAETLVDPEWGVAFVRSLEAAAPLPIATHGTLPEKTGNLLRLGRWAASCLDVAVPIHGDAPLVAAILDDGALVAWRSGDAILAGWTNVRGPARLLNRRAVARRRT